MFALYFRVIRMYFTLQTVQAFSISVIPEVAFTRYGKNNNFDLSFCAVIWIQPTLRQAKEVGP